MNIIVFTSIIWIISFADGQSQCNTSTGTGCISIYDCEVLSDIADNPNKTPQQAQLLRSSTCRTRGQTLTVCCPSGCTTPDGKKGECVNIYSCPDLANRLRPPVSQQNRLYVQSSRCVSSDKQSVCCPPPRKSNLNSICSAKQTAFPPDPKDGDCCGYDSNLGNKIYGGTPTAVDMYPWLCIIEYDKVELDKVSCGGSLISGRYVLTAAHCISDYALRVIGNPTAVRLGEYDIFNEGKDCAKSAGGGLDCTDGIVRINIENVIVHPEYSTFSKKNDIGLLRLQTMAPFTDFIRPICLPKYDITLNPPPPENFTLFVAGWGATENRTPSNVKLHVNVPYVPLERCQRVFSDIDSRINLWENQICAGGEPDKDSCKGDSGGPLMYKNGRNFELLGVVSFGSKPCANSPGVQTKTYSYLRWINDNIRN